MTLATYTDPDAGAILGLTQQSSEFSRNLALSLTSAGILFSSGLPRPTPH